MRKSKLKLNFLILIIVAAMAACRKDEPLPCSKIDEYCCDDYPQMWSSWFFESRFQFKSPCFNPNNSNEFIYYYNDWELGKRQLIKYNILTQQKAILADNFNIAPQPKWSSNGWIAFNRIMGGLSEHIFIVKDNGDSLRQFTINTSNLFPAWNSTGNKLYWAHSPVLGVPYFFLSQNLYGVNIDTLLYDGDAYQGYSFFNDISINDKLVAETIIDGQKQLAVADSIKKPLIFDKLFVNSESLTGLSWSAQGESVYFSLMMGKSDIDGLFKINTLTGKKERLLCVCQSKYYTNLSCSSDGKYLIAERVDSQLEKDTIGNLTGKIIQSSTISLIDLETLNETKLNLE